MNPLPVTWLSVLSGRPIKFSTSSGVMPICNLANLLLGVTVPTISPSIDPSLDFTICPVGVGFVASEEGFVLSEVLAVSVLCCVAQPIRKTRQIAGMNRLLRCIRSEEHTSELQ